MTILTMPKAVQLEVIIIVMITTMVAMEVVIAGLVKILIITDKIMILKIIAIMIVLTIILTVVVITIIIKEQ